MRGLRDGFNETNPRELFSLWKNIDTDFKDLIDGLTTFDPAKRLTAHEALAHRWFGDVQAQSCIFYGLSSNNDHAA